MAAAPATPRRWGSECWVGLRHGGSDDGAEEFGARANTHAWQAARFAVSLAQQAHTRVTLLTVLAMPEVISIGALSSYAVAGPSQTDAEVKKVREMLEKIRQEHPPGVEIVCAVEIGEVVETIVDFAQREKADLIVLGAKGSSAAKRFLVGSISDRVVHHAHCPVTVWR